MTDREKHLFQLQEELDKREEELLKKQQRLDDMEKHVKAAERSMKEKEKAKKQVLLRLAPGLWEELAKWAEDDFRSINGQIEYLLAEAVRRRKD